MHDIVHSCFKQYAVRSPYDSVLTQQWRRRDSIVPQAPHDFMPFVQASLFLNAFLPRPLLAFPHS